MKWLKDDNNWTRIIPLLLMLILILGCVFSKIILWICAIAGITCVMFLLWFFLDDEYNSGRGAKKLRV